MPTHVSAKLTQTALNLEEIVRNIRKGIFDGVDTLAALFDESDNLVERMGEDSIEAAKKRQTRIHRYR